MQPEENGRPFELEPVSAPLDKKYPVGMEPKTEPEIDPAKMWAKEYSRHL